MGSDAAPLTRPAADDAERPDPRARRLEIARRRLAEWQGAQATLVEYRPWMSTLLIRLQRPGERGHLQVVCTDTESICAPTRWQPASLRLEPARGLVVDPRADPGVELSDPPAGVLVRCGSVECKLELAP